MGGLGFGFEFGFEFGFGYWLLFGYWILELSLKCSTVVGDRPQTE